MDDKLKKTENDSFIFCVKFVKFDVLAGSKIILLLWRLYGSFFSINPFIHGETIWLNELMRELAPTKMREAYLSNAWTSTILNTHKDEHSTDLDRLLFP